MSDDVSKKRARVSSEEEDQEEASNNNNAHNKTSLLNSQSSASNNRRSSSSSFPPVSIFRNEEMPCFDDVTLQVSSFLHSHLSSPDAGFIEVTKQDNRRVKPVVV